MKKSFDYRVDESVSHAKYGIDIRVESVKTELDRIRDCLFDDLDHQGDLLKKLNRQFLFLIDDIT